MPFVLGLTGLASAGKGEVSNYLVKKYGFTKMVFSDVLREEAKRRNLLENKSYEEQKYVLSKLGEKLREESGRWDILAIKLIEKIKAEKIERVVVDGFRSVEEVNLFKKNFDKFNLVFIDADEKIRFERRKAEDPRADIENFMRRDKENIEVMGLGKVIEIADLKISNNEQGFKKLYERVDDLLNKINH
jgi:dephospho-CoA kinase